MGVSKGHHVSQLHSTTYPARRLRFAAHSRQTTREFGRARPLHSADANRKNSGQAYAVYGLDQRFDAQDRLSQFTETQGNDASQGFVINRTRKHDLAGGLSNQAV